MELLSGWGVVSDSWKLGAPGNDGKSFGTYSRAHDSKVQVSDDEFIDSFFLKFPFQWMSVKTRGGTIYTTISIRSKGAEKYFKRGSRLRWPEGAISRESINAVKKLGHLKVGYVFYCLGWIFN